MCVAACVRAGEAAAWVVPAARLKTQHGEEELRHIDGNPQRGMPHRGGVPPTRRRCRLAGTLGARWVSVRFEAERRCGRSDLGTARHHISRPGAPRCAPACRPVCQATAVQPYERQPAARTHGPAGCKRARRSNGQAAKGCRRRDAGQMAYFSTREFAHVERPTPEKSRLPCTGITGCPCSTCYVKERARKGGGWAGLRGRSKQKADCACYKQL